VVLVSDRTVYAFWLVVFIPLRDISVIAGDGSRLKVEDESPLLAWGGLGETSVVVGSEKISDGVSMSGVKAGRS
jgi:hypothetical protein